MAVPKILKGDDTSANGRGITLTLPDRDMGGLKVCAVFFGHEFVFDSPAPGSTVRLDFKADQTRLMPVGTHNMGLYVIGPDGASYTLSETIKVGVTDNVAEAYGGDASNINLAIEMKSGLPDLSEVPANPRTANALAEAFKKLLDTLKGSAFAIAFMACLTALGAGVNVQKERIGDVDFDAEVVTNVTFDATGLVKTEEIADVVREDGLKSMSWTNENFKTAVEAVSPRVELPTDIVNSVNNQTGRVHLTAYSIGAVPFDSLNAGLYETVLGDDFQWLFVDDGHSPFGQIWNYGSTSGIDFRSVRVNGKDVATEEQIRTKADEFTEWVCTPVLPSGWFIRRTEGGIGQDPGYQLWNNEGYVEDFYASLRDDKLEFQFPYTSYTAKRGRVLYSGDPSLNAAFNDWRTNDNQVALGNSSVVAASKGIAIGLKTSSDRTTIAGGGSSIAFGIGAQTSPSGAAAIAFGANASANAANAVQIGQGVNATAETLQFRNYRLLNADGTIPAERLGAAVTAETVTNAVECVRDLMYDAKTGVTWKRVMDDGNLYYIAVTNVDLLAN